MSNYDFVITAYEGVVVAQHWGEKGLFYNPGNLFPKGVYLLSFKEKDGPHDVASNVNRPGVYRLNLGIARPTFIKLFGSMPQRPPAGQVVQTGHDFQQLDKIMPHPVYGWMAWIGVLNPSPVTFEKLKPLIEEVYQLAVKRFDKRLKKGMIFSNRFGGGRRINLATIEVLFVFFSIDFIIEVWLAPFLRLNSTSPHPAPSLYRVPA